MWEAMKNNVEGGIRNAEGEEGLKAQSSKLKVGAEDRRQMTEGRIGIATSGS
jgi:hypothetical protein